MNIRPCTYTFLLLIVLTFATFAIGEVGYSSLGVAMLVLGFAIIKSALIGDWFMGLHGLRGIWRWVIYIWLLIPGALITYAFNASYAV